MQRDNDSRKGCYCRSQDSLVCDSDEYASPLVVYKVYLPIPHTLVKSVEVKLLVMNRLHLSMFNDISGIFSNRNLPSGLEGNL